MRRLLLTSLYEMDAPGKSFDGTDMVSVGVGMNCCALARAAREEDRT